MLLSLKPGKYEKLMVSPRWPSRVVTINSDVLSLLHQVANELPIAMQLIITRGYECPKSATGGARKFLRSIGRAIFLVLYPYRRHEISEIFSYNGHDVDGHHVDLSIIVNGRKISLLPFGVFTPSRVFQRRETAFTSEIRHIRQAIKRVGGTFHLNRLEALQMHVDFMG